jgi:hypothetical protein
MTDPVVTSFEDAGLSWHAGGTYVPDPNGPPPDVRPINLAVIVVEGGDVHLRLVLPGAPNLPVGEAIIPPAKLADVIAAMQQAAPVTAKADAKAAAPKAPEQPQHPQHAHR